MRSWVFAAAFAMQGSGVSAELQCDRDLLVDMASEILAVRGGAEGLFRL